MLTVRSTQVARPFKAKPYNDPYVGSYSIYQGTHYKGHANTTAGPAVSPLKTRSEVDAAFSVDPTYGPGGARVPTDRKDDRLNKERHGYGTGEWKGNSHLKPGGGTYVVDPKPRPSVIPSTPPKPAYGAGAYTQDFSITHPDCDGFQEKLAKRGGQVSVLEAHPPPSRGMHFASDPIPANPYMYGSSESSTYGGGQAVSPAVKNRHDPNPGVAGVHYGARQGGVSENKYLPTSDEAVMGHNAVVPGYGSGKFASPQKPMVHAKYGYGFEWKQRRDLAGYGAYVSPRSGIY